MQTFTTLLEENRVFLERFVKYRIPNRHDAEDILQECYLAAYRNFASLKNQEAFKSWLLGIAHRKCNDYFRSLAKNVHIPLDELPEAFLCVGSHGLTERMVVRDTLTQLGSKEQQILYLYFFENISQEEIAARLHIPLGTVKSRLHHAKQKFKERYPYPPRPKGEFTMQKIPTIMPSYTITKLVSAPFPVKHEELPGMFIIPKPGAECSFAMYDMPNRNLSGVYHLKVTGNVVVHGIPGVTIQSEYKEGCVVEKQTLFAQLTDTHCRYLGGIHYDDSDTQRFVTFLDEEFAQCYNIGPDNCGFSTNRTSCNVFNESPDGNITTSGNSPFPLTEDISDICGRYSVTINGHTYDTVRIIDIQITDLGTMLCEYYVDQTGRTVLWRRFNHNSWAYNRYQKTWTEMQPDQERVILNGETFVHWYDCITDYVL